MRTWDEDLVTYGKMKDEIQPRGDRPTPATFGRNPEKLRRVSTPEAVANQIASDILDGHLIPGEELREVELSERFGVSRSSLREAITELAYRGLIDRQPHKSVRVATLSETDLADLMRVRALLESDAIRTLAENRETWPSMERLIDSLSSLSNSAEWSVLAEWDIEFHRALVRAAGSHRLTRTHDALVDEMRLLFAVAPRRHYYNVPEMEAEHRALVNAIVTGDPDQAEHQLRAHLMRRLDFSRE